MRGRHGWNGGSGRHRRGPAAHECEALCETLDRVRRGDRFEIVGIADDDARVTALRFGMAEGAHASCAVRIPAGPIVVMSGRQEVAVGRRLARRIRVRRLGEARGDE